MKTFIVYTSIVVFIIVIFIFTRRYKYEIIQKIDKKENPLRKLYSLCAFIIDKTERNISKSYDNDIATKLDKINTGNHQREDIYTYKLHRLSLAIGVFILFIIIGYIKCIQQTFLNDDIIKQVERQDVGGGDKEYVLEAKLEDGEKEKVYINLAERKLSEEEIKEIMDDSYDNIKRELLGKNVSVEEIIYDLNMISEYEDMIDIVWNIKEDDYIDYSGKILWDKINDNEEINIEGIFTINNYSRSYFIKLKLDKRKREYKDVLNDELNKYIMDYSSSEKVVELPDYIDDKKVVFEKSNDENTIICFIFAILFGVIFFIAKNKDLQNKMAKRNSQLEVDYAALVSKMTILYTSGMTVMAAWDKIIDDYDKHICEKRYVYEEMKIAKKRMMNGLSETKAIVEFGKRCGLHQYVKFSNILEQNIRKGTVGLKEIMRQELNESYEIRRALALKKGDEAGTKLLLPMGVMLVISIIIIIIPAFLSLNL